MLNTIWILTKIFFDLHPYDEIFRKQPEYKEHHEARMIIPNVNFLRNPIYYPSLYYDNEMNVPVPELQSYSLFIQRLNAKLWHLKISPKISEDTIYFVETWNDTIRDSNNRIVGL